MSYLKNAKNQALNLTKISLENKGIKPEATKKWINLFVAEYIGTLMFILVDSYGLPKNYVLEKIEELEGKNLLLETELFV